MQKPTIVFVTGAWVSPHLQPIPTPKKTPQSPFLTPLKKHKPDLYTPLTSALESAGYTVKAPHLPSVGGKTPSFNDDVTTIRESITASTDAGQDVVVLMHSYGGIPGSEAVEGLTRLDQSSSREKGCVIRLIYLAAFVIAEKGSMMSGLGGQPLEWWDHGKEQMIVKKGRPAEVFYNGVDAATAEELEGKLVGHATGSFESKVSYAAWKHVQSTYIVCEKDNAIPAEVQEKMAGQPGGKITVERLDAGHSPWMTDLEDTVKVIRKAIGEQV